MMSSVNILLIPLAIMFVAYARSADVIAPRGFLSEKACEGNTLNIKCDSGRISVIRANYGRNSKTECNADGSKPVLSADCRALNSLRIVKAKCNNQKQCSVPATTAVFGDPCKGTYKYLDVDYQCNPVKSKKIACEGKELELKCEQGRKIKVLSANYGRTSKLVCPSADAEKIKNTNCVSRQKSEQIVAKRCNGNQRCSISASNAVFGDVCFGTLKYLEVEFICEK